MQGVIKAFDPRTRTGSLLDDRDSSEIELAADALSGSLFRMLRQGQRVVFDLDADGRATRLRFGSEVDLGEPLFPGDMPPATSIRPPQRRAVRSKADGDGEGDGDGDGDGVTSSP